MRAAGTLPRPIRVIDPLWIVMADGARLAARVWLPEDAEARPVPAILEYLPYRLRDGTALRDEPLHRYLAGHGYACVRVDMRGSGDSDGVLRDEYLAQEQDDALEVIAWLAAQPWCSGAVGMMGISWGGFNALQVAMRRPPALKAIVTVASADDRYGGDTHYMGGCLLGGNMGWGCAMTALLTLPPDPAIVGERWRTLWRERLDNLPLLAGEWMRHPHRDAYWRHGSVCEDYGAIECAVYAVGGWEDPYHDAILRLTQHLKAPVKALIGPWAHHYPHIAHIAPMGFLQECLRWWDYWLKGLDTGVMAEPRVRLWLQDGVRPQPLYYERPGRWIAEHGWPTAAVKPLTLALNAYSLDCGAPLPEVCLTHGSNQWVGIAAGTWCPYGHAAEMPGDQREEDGGSLCFDSAPLKERLEVVGTPEVIVTLASDRPQALICARLCEVFPDGASTRVSYGLLNLCQRNGDAAPSALEPGRRYQVKLRLNAIAHVFLPGNHIRLALSTGYWPMVWPAPEAVLLNVYTGAASSLILPVRHPNAADAALTPFAEPEVAACQVAEELEPADRRFLVERDVAAERQTVIVHRSWGRLRFLADGLEVEGRGVERYSIHREDPFSARCEITWTLGHRRGPWRIRTETETALSADRTHFHLVSQARAYEGDDEFAIRDYDFSIPRFIPSDK